MIEICLSGAVRRDPFFLRRIEKQIELLRENVPSVKKVSVRLRSHESSRMAAEINIHTMDLDISTAISGGDLLEVFDCACKEIAKEIKKNGLLSRKEVGVR